MKILQINVVCGIGSTGRITIDLYHIIESHEHESIIAYGRGKAPKGIKTIKIGSDFSVNVHGVLSRLTDRQGFYSTCATKSLIKKIKKYNPDIIHLHNIHGYYLNVNLLFKYFAKSDKQIVWTLYDCWSFTGHCCHYDFIGCQKWKKCCNSCAQKHEYPKSIFLDNSSKNYKKKEFLFNSIDKLHIIVPSKWMYSQLISSFLNSKDITVIPNGIDLNNFTAKPDCFKNKYGLQNKFMILGVANIWVKEKGIKCFSELAEIISDEYKIVLVGVIPSQKVSSKILSIPKTDSISELITIYSDADVFVNPTLQETQGLTNIEALACGTPVVTFRSGGSPECIDETCGFVVEKGNNEDLYQAIQKVVKEKPFSKEACISRSKKYDKNVCYEEYLKLYETLLCGDAYE